MSSNSEELSPEIVNKFQAAADIANKALEKVKLLCIAGAKISDICIAGDDEIKSLSSKTFSKSSSIIKGVAFPTCISVNEIACHHAPMAEIETCLKNGDLVKIELGAHIDGFPVLVGTSLVVGGVECCSEAVADALAALETAGEAALRCIKPGRTSTDFISTLSSIYSEFGVVSLEGNSSYQVLKDNLDGTESGKVIVTAPADPSKKSPLTEFKVGQIWNIDLAVSSGGEGKVKELPDEKVTVYRKTNLSNYSLKIKSSRQVFSEIGNNFGHMPFHVRALEDGKKARFALSECVNHGLLQPYQVLTEKNSSAVVARVICTVLLLPNGPYKLSNWTSPSLGRSQKTLSNVEIKKLLEEPVRLSKKKDSNKK